MCTGFFKKSEIRQVCQGRPSGNEHKKNPIGESTMDSGPEGSKTI